MAGGLPWERPLVMSTSLTPPPVSSLLVASIGEGTIAELAWSADSRWLAWSEPVTSFGSRSRLRLVQVGAEGIAGAGPVDVTDGRFCDRSPSFTPDGKFLAFLSNRSFDPVYDGHSFDLSFPSPIKPYLVALAADTPSPFGPAVDLDGTDSSGDTEGDQDADAVPEVRVDADGLAHRVIGVPVPQGNYSALRATEGALLWLDSALSGVTGDGKASQEDKDTPPAWSASTWRGARQPPWWRPLTPTAFPETAGKLS